MIVNQEDQVRVPGVDMLVANDIVIEPPKVDLPPPPTPKVYVTYMGLMRGVPFYDSAFVSIPAITTQIQVEQVSSVLLQQGGFEKVLLLGWKSLEG